MRGSTVFHSLRSWTSKLHQQLPLSPRESQRLLNALTTSFREQLDHVHPTGAGGDQSQTKTAHGNGSHAPTTASSRGLHSSAASADKHLASILTNPLLAKGAATATSDTDRELAKAKAELERHPAQDPIALLEEHHERGAASVALARLCLAHFEASLRPLEVTLQKKRVAEVQPGKRILWWLWRSDSHQTTAFVDDLTFYEPLVKAVVREDLESYLWEWLRIDMKLAEAEWVDGPQNRSNVASQSFLARERHGLRWKGRLLRTLVLTKLVPPYGETPSLNNALDCFFRGMDLHDGGCHIPLQPAGSLLVRAVCPDQYAYERVDVSRYDRFRATVNRWASSNGANQIQGSSRRRVAAGFDLAQLDLHHPEAPSPKSTLSMFSLLHRYNYTYW
ncbi:hypothetical protein BAUCODRAFT_27202 [Baudoinia panamericana UAMH 10762]|uniref:Uncharacterized protein n=1 Tax=Baudoinia panamericana (strain UAMH 10762) TaxID=717646 RepID=M2M8Z3_BAUPA|nr:uncharacterized protein BAUCODRAFT_27202 [Baudoinia panamericana UAMH 10762]EMC92876.1 hypothetical protein BAUCODRAFT_27202 [Baudoinia panamericana UAMH 10762]